MQRQWTAENENHKTDTENKIRCQECRVLNMFHIFHSLVLSGKIREFLNEDQGQRISHPEKGDGG